MDVVVVDDVGGGVGGGVGVVGVGVGVAPTTEAMLNGFRMDVNVCGNILSIRVQTCSMPQLTALSVHLLTPT